MRFTRENTRAAHECCAARTRRRVAVLAQQAEQDRRAQDPDDADLDHEHGQQRQRGPGERRDRAARHLLRDAASAQERQVRRRVSASEQDEVREGQRRAHIERHARDSGGRERESSPNDPIGSRRPARENGGPRCRHRRSISMRRLHVLVVAVAFAFAFAAGPGRALTLLTEENPPFNYVENGKLTGLVTGLVVDAMKRANVPYTMEVLPWNRAYMRAQAEKDTCLFATARLDNREKLFNWVGPLASNLWAVYGRGDFAGTVRQLPDLKSYRIGGVVNDAKVEYMKENGVTNIRQAPEDRLNPPRLFLAAEDPNRIDLWVTGFYGARDVARVAKVSDLKLVFILREIPLYLACSPQTSPAVVKALSDAVDKMRAEGVLARAIAEYEKRFAK